MARTDDDSWDITETVGATALGVAMARAEETEAACPLFTDPYAQMFLDAAAARGWISPFNDDTVAQLQKSDPRLGERMKAMWGYTASRTKYFDEFFIAAGAVGIQQAVILAAGLDARAWRLPWVTDSVVYEIDQPKVLAFKTETLRANDAKPATEYVAVPIDLRQDWPKALRDAGFDSTEPTAWSAEGLLPYLPADAKELLFGRIHELSATGSRVAVEAFGPAYFEPDSATKRRVRIEQMREAAAKAGQEMPDPEELFFAEEHTDVAEWLRDHGWEVSTTGADELMARYHREPPDYLEDGSAPSVFVDGQLNR
jgi:methyltransferase (TIGR00027 family)